MSRGTKLRARARLALGARMAAASLSAGVRRAHEIGRGHRPVPLRWRRRATTGAAAHAFTRQALSVTWAPRSSFSFSLAVQAGRRHPGRCPRRSTSITHRYLQKGENTIRTTVASPLVTHCVHSVQRYLLSLGLFGGRVRSVEGRERRGGAQTARRAGPLVLDRVRSALSARDSVTSVIAARFIDRSLCSVSRSTVRRFAADGGKRSSDPRGTSGAVRGHPAGAARQVTPGPVELGWRRSDIAVAGTSPQVSIEGTAPAAPSVRRPSTSPPNVAGMTASPAAIGTPRPFSLDASQLDRLTDDVIRRVERRVRIARERRGL